MADLKQYIASSGAGELPAEAELDALLARCEWFDLARIVREIATGRPDPRLDVTAPWRAQSSLRMAAVDADALCRLSSDDIIDRFLREEDLRIVAADGEPEEEVCTEAVLDDDDQVVRPTQDKKRAKDRNRSKNGNLKVQRPVPNNEEDGTTP